MPFVESFKEFCKRQGCEKFALPDGSGYLFSNGARATLDPFGRGLQAFVEPPVERFALLHAKRAFVAAKLDRYRGDLDDWSRQLQDQLNFAKASAVYCPPPTQKNMETLAILRKSVRELELELARIDTELAESPRAKAVSGQDQRNAEAVAEVARRQAEYYRIMDGYASPQPEPTPAEQAIRAQAENTAAVAAVAEAVDRMNSPPSMMGVGGSKKRK